jgi:hypothetical protein
MAWKRTRHLPGLSISSWRPTNRAPDEAIGLYRAVGYREVAAFNDEPYETTSAVSQTASVEDVR